MCKNNPLYTNYTLEISQLFNTASFSNKTNICRKKNISHQSAKILEYAKEFSATGDRKYIGTVKLPVDSKWRDKHSNKSNVTPEG